MDTRQTPAQQGSGSHLTTDETSRTENVRPFTPYSNSTTPTPGQNPTYAQVLTSPPPPPPPSQHPLPPQTLKRKVSFHLPPSNLPPLLPNPSFNPLPPPTKKRLLNFTKHPIPPNLSLPANPTAPDWYGRCFNCLQLGHIKAACRNAKKCAKCLCDGHGAPTCRGSFTNTKPLSPHATSFLPKRKTPSPATRHNRTPTSKPTMPLLTSPQVNSPQMPPPRPFPLLLAPDLSSLQPPSKVPLSRPRQSLCFTQPDDVLNQEISRLGQAVLVHITDNESLRDMRPDNVAEWCAESNLTSKSDVSVSRLKSNTFIVLLPPNLDRECFITSMPHYIWSKGISFQPWSLHHDGSTVIPSYKVWLNLLGLPPHLWTPREIANAVSSFGLFLGEFHATTDNNLLKFGAVIATTQLSLIPHYISFCLKGFEYQVQVEILGFTQEPLFQNEDLPPLPPLLRKKKQISMTS